VGSSANDQFRTVYTGDSPAGVALWALADNLVAERIDAGDTRLTAAEWKRGSNIRITDVVAPFGGEAKMRGQLSDARAERPVQSEMKRLFEGSVENRTGIDAYVGTTL
jgi:hemolysin-activating ACP:hemolysin acyltransferase